MDEICRNTLDMHRRGLSKEVLTVGNHADGVYLYLKLLKEDPGRAGRVMELLKTNGGNNSGIRIGCIDDVGEVHPDQFWMHYSLGNVTQRKFGEIWKDPSEPLLQGAEGAQEAAQGPLRPLPLSRPVQRQPARARRSRPRRYLGGGPGLLPDRSGNRYLKMATGMMEETDVIKPAAATGGLGDNPQLQPLLRPLPRLIGRRRLQRRAVDGRVPAPDRRDSRSGQSPY